MSAKCPNIPIFPYPLLPAPHLARPLAGYLQNPLTSSQVCPIIDLSSYHAYSRIEGMTIRTSQLGTEVTKEERMRGRIHFRLTLLAFLLMLAAGPNQVRGFQGPGPRAPAGVSASPGADAPWFVSELDTDGNTGLHASVAYDPSQGTIYISYYDATDQVLRLARSDGLGPEDCGPDGEWSCHTVDSGPDVGKYSSIAVNPKTGGIGIAYHDATNGHLKYLVFQNPHLLVYQKYTIDKGIPPLSATGLHTSLAYSEEGTPFIAYYFENSNGVDALMLAYYTVTNGDCGYGPIEDTWRCHTILSGEGVGQFPSLVVKNNPTTNDWDFYISFYDGGRGQLWFGKSVEGEPANCGLYGNDMACYGVAGGHNVGRYSSLYVDNTNRFHIAYYDATEDRLMYAVELASSTGNCGVLGSAQCDEIDSMLADYHPLGISIAEDPAGYPAIAYQAADQSLKLARPVGAVGLPPGGGNCGYGPLLSIWSCETIDRFGTWPAYRNGDFVSLDIAPSGVAHIAYNGFILSSGGNLVVAYQRYRVYLPLLLRNS